MSLIQISDLSFSYEGSAQSVFRSVSFRMDTDWKLGLIGRNGRGKTTLLRLLCHMYEYSGSITAQVSFQYFPFEWKNSSILTIQGVEQIHPMYELWKLQKELSMLQVDEDVLYRPFDSLSGGEQTKVMLAILFTKENHFLLLDEPTNHLDAEARMVVSEYLRKKKGFILVSHDRTFLDHCIDHVLSINKSDITIEKGNFSSWKENKDRADRFEMERNVNLKKEIKRLTNTARKTSERADEMESKKIGKALPRNETNISTRSYLGEKSRKLQQRRKNIEIRQQKAVEEKSSLLKNIEKSESLKLSMLSYHSKKLVSLSDVFVYYGDKVACQNVSFTIESGDRIALCGKNGSGKSSILTLILNENLSYTGELWKGKTLQISCVSQNTDVLAGKLSDFIKQEPTLEESRFKTILHKLGIPNTQFEKDISSFSAGQKKKVALAKSLATPAHLLIWDEPLNYIDLFSRMQIEELLLAFQPTILFVEHDQVFLNKIATKKIAL